jgi:hypothetical protein
MIAAALRQIVAEKTALRNLYDLLAQLQFCQFNICRAIEVDRGLLLGAAVSNSGACKLVAPVHQFLSAKPPLRLNDFPEVRIAAARTSGVSTSAVSALTPAGVPCPVEGHARQAGQVGDDGQWHALGAAACRRTESPPLSASALARIVWLLAV